MAKKTVENGQIRAWQRMLSGRRLDLLAPSPLDIEIQDIAHGLARVSRWNGQTKGAHSFSVAQHSILVTEIFNKLYKSPTQAQLLTCLLHDAPEYVISDLISPLKAVLGTEYGEVELRLEQAIHLRFGLPVITADRLRKQIKKADQIAAYFEAVDLAGFTAREAGKLFGKPRFEELNPPPLEPWPAETAQQKFLVSFEQLGGERL